MDWSAVFGYLLGLIAGFACGMSYGPWVGARIRRVFIRPRPEYHDHD
jgi:hypothetical protein